MILSPLRPTADSPGFRSSARHHRRTSLTREPHVRKPVPTLLTELEDESRLQNRHFSAPSAVLLSRPRFKILVLHAESRSIAVF